MKKIVKSVLCLLVMAISVFETSSCSCSESSSTTALLPTTELVTTGNNTTPEPSTAPNTTTSSIDIEKPPVRVGITSNELHVIELIYLNLSLKYDVFYAHVNIESFDEEIFGIGFTNYEDAYVDSNEHCYYETGFLCLDEEITIFDDYLSDKVEIIPEFKEKNEKYSYIYSQKLENLYGHFVKDNKYVTYDIVFGTLAIEEVDYYYGMDVESKRGNIYNYDTEEYVYIVEEIDGVPIYGESLVGEFNSLDIIKKVNEMIDNQTFNFTKEEIVSQIDYAHNAVNSYLLNLQEETFFGIPTEELVEISNNLDPLEHIRLVYTESGHIAINIIEVEEKATLAEKLIVGSVMAVCFIAAIIVPSLGIKTFATKVFINILVGTVIGAVGECFSHTVIQGNAFKNIDTTRIITSAIAGAVSGLANVLIASSALGGVAKFFINALVDGFIGGSEFFTLALINGFSFDEALKEFGTGFIFSMVLSALFSLAIEGIGLLVKGIKFACKKVKNWLTSGDSSLSKLSKEAAEDSISEVAEKNIKNHVEEGIENSVSNSASKQAKDAVNTSLLPGDNNTNWAYKNSNGEFVSKKQVTEGLKNGESGFSIVPKDGCDSNITKILKENNLESIPLKPDGNPDFSVVSLGKDQIELSISRSTNFKNIDNYYREKWSKNHNSIPKKIKEWFENNNIDLDNIKKTDMEEMRKSLKLTYHEAIEDGVSCVYIVSTYIHTSSYGGIGHYGAISKLTQNHIKEAMKSSIS